MSEFYFNNVILLLHGDGADGGTTFTDSSSKNRTVTSSGQARIETDDKKFGTASVYFDGVGDYLNIADSDDFYFGAGDFTIEAWVRPLSSYDPYYQTIEGILSQRYRLGEKHSFSFWLRPDGMLGFEANNGAYGCYSATGVITLDAWQHVAVCRSGNTLRLFVNGQIVKEQAISITLSNEDQQIQIGRTNSSQTNSYFEGYIDEVRVTKGIGRYTANFTAPTEAFPNENNGEYELALVATLGSDATNVSASHVLPRTTELAAVLSGDSATITGVHAQPITLTLAATLGSDASQIAAAHVPPVALTLAAALGSDASTVAGIATPYVATLAATLGSDASTVAGKATTGAHHGAAWSLRVEAGASAVWSIPLPPASHGLAWGDATTVNRAHGLAWDDTPVVSATLASLWADMPQPAASHQAAWADRPTASLAHALAWEDATAATLSHAAAWEDRPTTSQAHAARWAGTALPAATHAAVWADRPSVARDHQAPWADRPTASQTHQAAWADRPDSAATHAAAWNLRGETTASHALAWSLNERPNASATLRATWSLLATSTLISIDAEPTVTWQGQALSLTAASLSCDEDSPVWIAERLQLADRAVWGQIALGDDLTLTIGAETWSLRVDGKGADYTLGDEGLSLSAVSPLAWLDAPYAASQSLETAAAISAQTLVAALLAPVGPVTWALPDWLIPPGAVKFSDATPLAIARAIVAAIGGVLESAPDGTPLARRRHPVSVPDYPSADPDQTFLPGDLFASQRKAAPRAGFNRVLVSNTDMVSSEGRDRLEYARRTDTEYAGTVSAYPEPWRAVTLAHTGHPATVITPQGAVITTRRELVEFVDGQGSVEYPVHALLAVTWQHVDLGAVTANGQALSAAVADGESLAWIDYTSRAIDFSVALDRDEAVQFVLI